MKTTIIIEHDTAQEFTDALDNLAKTIEENDIERYELMDGTFNAPKWYLENDEDE